MKAKKHTSKRKTLNAAKQPSRLTAADCSSFVGMDTIEEFIATLEASAKRERARMIKDGSHAHGYSRGKEAAFIIAVSQLRKLTAF